MAQQVVTELVIDSSRAVSGAAEYTRAMDGAQSAMQRSLGAMSDGIASVRDGIAGMGQAAANVVPSVGQMAVGVGGAVAVVLALSKAAQEFAHDLANMGSAARRANLDVESFQKLQFAASLEGIANKDFSSGIEKMALRLNDASRNENDLSKLLDANNIKFKDANGTLISTNALLDKARDLISRAANEQDKIKMAEMLGLTREWVPLLDKSAQQFADIQTEVTRLGLVIDANTIKKAEEFDREWRKSSTVFSTWMRAQLAELLPVLEDLIAKSVLFGKSVMESFAAATSGPAAQEFTARSDRAAAILEMLDVNNSAKENADIVAAAAKAMAGTLSETTKALLDQQIAAKQTVKMWNDIASGWEGAAAAGQNLIKSIPTGAANDNKGPHSVVPARDINDERDAWDRAVTSIDKHIGRLAADTLAIGQSTAAHDQLRAEFQLLEAAKVADRDVTDAQIAAYTILRGSMSSQQALAAAGIKLNEDDAASFDRVTQAINAASEANLKAKIANDISRDRQMALLSPQDVQIAQQLKGLYPDIATALESSEAAQIRFNNAMKEAKDIGNQFAQTMVKGLFDQKAGADAVSKAFEALAKNLAAKSIESLLNGDFEKAAVQAIAAVTAALISLFTHTQDLKTTIDTLDRLNQLRLRQVQANADTNTLQGQLAVYNANAILQQIDEARKGGQLMGALLQVQNEERLKIERDFQAQAAQIEQQAAEERLRKQQEIEKRRQGFDDQLFGLLHDTGTLQDQLAVFDLQAQRAREDEVRSGGEALVNLEALQAQQRLGIINDFNQKAIDESKRAAQEQLDAQTRAAKGIVDYINNLKVGPDSSLAPTARLAAAQSTYDSILALAQGGNVDALSRISQDAENLRKAAQAVYGSAGPYQNILNTIIAQLQSLPAVATSTDPVVQAVLGVQAALTNGGQTAAQLLTTSIARLDTSIVQFGNMINNLTAAVSALTNGAGWLASINSLSDTSRQQLQLLNQQFSGSLSIVTAPPPTSGPIGAISVDGITVNNTMLFALNKIVWNTRQMAEQLIVITSRQTTGTLFGTTPANHGVYAQGGILPAYGIGIMGEHHPQGPFIVQAGASPIPITPSLPSFANDNTGIRQELNDIKRILAAVGAAMVNAESKTGAEVAGAIVAAINGQTETIKQEARQDRANPQKKVA